MASNDLFDEWLPALWTKARLEGKAPIFIMHRFLASEPDLAVVSKELQHDFKEPAIMFRVWQGLLPRARSAPRLSYVAPKRTPDAELLVQKIMEVEHVRRDVAEAALEVLTMDDKVVAAQQYYGIDPR